MGVFDKFINAIRINDYDDDYDGDEKDFYEDQEPEEEPVPEKPKKGLFSRIVNRDKDEDYDEEETFELKPEPAVRVSQPQQQSQTVVKTAAPKPQKTYSPKVTPIKRRGGSPMEVCVIKPSSMEDTREIADTLLSNCTVVLNLEGIDVELAQRVIDFTSGACYSIDGSLQKVSSYIFILTPPNVEISGDITDILNGAVGSSNF